VASKKQNGIQLRIPWTFVSFFIDGTLNVSSIKIHLTKLSPLNLI
jgi:hypothetical protein